MAIRPSLQRMLPSADPWIVRGTKGSATQVRVFCFHCAGGSAGQFREWDTLAPRNVEIVAIQLPGREHRMREPPVSSFPDLIAGLIHSLIPCLDRPYVLFGHSLGALTAFEVARTLRTMPVRQPEALCVAARSAPQLAISRAPVDEYPTHKLIEVLQMYGGVSEEMLRDTALMQDLLPMIRADFRLVRNYGYEKQPPLAYPILALGGTADASCREADLRAWAAQTCHSFECRMFPGGHFFLRQHTAALVDVLARMTPLDAESTACL